MDFWRRIFGSPAPPVIDPVLGRLYRLDDEDVVRDFGITSSAYNIYEKEGHHWLSLVVKAESDNGADEEDELEPWLEMNLPFDETPGALLRVGAVLKVESYHEELFNLTSMYYWTHSPFDGQILIESVNEGSFSARVTGESDHEPVDLRAIFKLNSDLRRSFS